MQNTQSIVNRALREYRSKREPVLITKESVPKLFELLNNTQDDKIEKLANILKASAHPLRLKVLMILAEREFRILDIREKLGTSQSNISQHIDILRRNKVINSKKVGQEMVCSLRNPDAVKMILNLGGLSA